MEMLPLEVAFFADVMAAEDSFGKDVTSLHRTIADFQGNYITVQHAMHDEHLSVSALFHNAPLITHLLTRLQQTRRHEIRDERNQEICVFSIGQTSTRAPDQNFFTGTHIEQARRFLGALPDVAKLRHLVNWSPVVFLTGINHFDVMLKAAFKWLAVFNRKLKCATQNERELEHAIEKYESALNEVIIKFDIWIKTSPHERQAMRASDVDNLANPRNVLATLRLTSSLSIALYNLLKKYNEACECFQEKNGDDLRYIIENIKNIDEFTLKLREDELNILPRKAKIPSTAERLTMLREHNHQAINRLETTNGALIALSTALLTVVFTTISPTATWNPATLNAVRIAVFLNLAGMISSLGSALVRRKDVPHVPDPETLKNESIVRKSLVKYKIQARFHDGKQFAEELNATLEPEAVVSLSDFDYSIASEIVYLARKIRWKFKFTWCSILFFILAFIFYGIALYRQDEIGVVQALNWLLSSEFVTPFLIFGFSFLLIMGIVSRKWIRKNVPLFFGHVWHCFVTSAKYLRKHAPSFFLSSGDRIVAFAGRIKKHTPLFFSNIRNKMRRTD